MRFALSLKQAISIGALRQEAFPSTGHMDFYDFGQEDEGDSPDHDDAGAWHERDGAVSLVQSDCEDTQAPDCRSSAAQTDLSAAQKSEVERTQDRLAALDRALEAASNEPNVVRTIQQARDQIMKEASGRTQRDSVVAAALRRQDQLAQDVDAGQLAAAADARRAQQAREDAYNDALAGLEDRLARLAAQAEPKAGSLRSSEARASDVARERRAAISAAAINFKLDKLGIGRVH